MVEKEKHAKAIGSQVYVSGGEGGGMYTKRDGTVAGNDGKTYQLVPVASDDCRTADSKPSSYTHQGAIKEAQGQLNLAVLAPCSKDQNAYLKRVIELISYVETGTRQR